MLGSRFGAASVWLAVCFCTTHASAQSIQGARFDPTPVIIDQVAAAMPRPVMAMDLLTLRDPKGLSISPDAQNVAFVVGQAVYESNSYRSGLFVVSTDGAHRVRALGSAGMPHWDDINQWPSENPQWSPDGKRISYRMRMNAEEHWQVSLWNLQNGQRDRLTSVDGDVESYRWFPDGSALFLTVVRPQRRSGEETAGEHGVLFHRELHPYQVIPVLTQMEASKEPEREYWIHDARTHRERRATEKEVSRWLVRESAAETNGVSPLAKYEIVSTIRSPDGSKTAYLYGVNDSSEARTGARRLLLTSGHDHRVIELTPNAYFIDQCWWTSDGRTLYFTERSGRGRSVELRSVEMQELKSRSVFQANGSDYLSSFSSDNTGRWIVCLRENNTMPARVALIDAATQEMRTLVDLNPGFLSLQRSSGERLEGTNRYGEDWFAYLVKPFDYENGKKYPLIVTTYRSGDYFLRGASGDENPIQVYAAHGFAVLCFDVGFVRNTAPGDFSAKLLDWLSPTTSMGEAIERLADEGIIDPSRVGIAGFSHGEEIAGYAVTHTDLFHAAVGAQNYDPCFYFLGGEVWRGVFERWGLGGWPGGESKEKWQKIAMSMNADQIKTPILENASDSEYLIYLSTYRSLTDLGKPIELYIYPQELHVRNQPKHRLEIYERNLDWFCFWLKQEEHPDRAKVEQYRRWRHLRDGTLKSPG